MKKQMAFILWSGEGDSAFGNIQQLNQLLNGGWRVSSASPMGGGMTSYGYSGLNGTHPPQGFYDCAFRSLVILEQ